MKNNNSINDKINKIKDLISKNKQHEALLVLEEVIELLNGGIQLDVSAILNETNLLKGKINLLNKNHDLTFEEKSKHLIKISREILTLISEVDVPKKEIVESNLKTIRVQIELKYINWKPSFKTRFISSLANYLGTTNEKIQFVKSERGSIILYLNIPHFFADKLILDFNNKNSSILTLINTFNISSISYTNESSAESEPFLAILSESDITTAILKLKGVLKNIEHDPVFNGLIQSWIESELLDRNNLFEELKFNTETQKLKQEILALAKKHFNQYTYNTNIKDEESKQGKFDIRDFSDIIKDRILKNNLKGAFELLESINLTIPQVNSLRSKTILINDLIKEEKIDKKESTTILNTIQEELLKIIDSSLNVASAREKKNQETSSSSIIGTWKLELLAKEEYFVLDLLERNKITGWKKIDLNTNLKWETKINWLKEINTKIPNFSISIDGEWYQIDETLKIELTYSLKNIMGIKGQNIIKGTIGNLITRNFEFDLKETKSPHSLVGHEYGSINEEKVILELIEGNI